MKKTNINEIVRALKLIAQINRTTFDTIKFSKIDFDYLDNLIIMTEYGTYRYNHDANTITELFHWRTHEKQCC